MDCYWLDWKLLRILYSSFFEDRTPEAVNSFIYHRAKYGVCLFLRRQGQSKGKAYLHSLGAETKYEAPTIRETAVDFNVCGFTMQNTLRELVDFCESAGFEILPVENDDVYIHGQTYLWRPVPALKRMGKLCRQKPE